MATFEVRISSAASKPLRVRVRAATWVAAWQAGLRALGLPAMPQDTACTVAADGVVFIEMPAEGRRGSIRQVPDDAPRHAPRLVGEAGPGPSRRHAPAPEGASARRPLVRQPEGHVAVTLGTAPDPITTLLSDLARQRRLWHPLRISPITGLPTTNDARRGARCQATPQSVPRSAPATHERHRSADLTQAFVALASDELPQHFRSVHSNGGPPDTWDQALRWAVDTTWQQLPCALVLAVSSGDGHVAEVLAARGEREREARGCQIACDAEPIQMGRAPSLFRFASMRPLSFQGPGEQTWALPVGSLLWAPLAEPSGALMSHGLALINATRPSGFTDGELRAMTYLARTLLARS